MKYFVKKGEGKPVKNAGHTSYLLLGDKNGCLAGCKTGISYYTCTVYQTPGVHEDQEGFFVIEGMGWAQVGSQEFKLEPDVSFIVPPKVPHAIKRDPNYKYVKLFWFHAAI